MAAVGDVSVSTYLLLRLEELGVKRIFGIPGDYVLPFFDEVLDGPHGVQHVMPCSELNGTYMADGYAKRVGFGAMAATFGPGCLSAVNGVAGAYADDVPLLLVCGTPAAKTLRKPSDRLLHHALGTNLDAYLEIFRPITVQARRVASAEGAAELIDGMLAESFKTKKPCYLEIPYDLQTAQLPRPSAPLDLSRGSSEPALRKSLARAAELLGQARTRSVVAGHLVLREGLSACLLELVRLLGASCASTFACKDGSFESCEHAVGVYCGAMSKDSVKAAIEGQDESHVALAVGLTNNEFDTGVFTSHLDKHHLITIGQGRALIDGEVFEDVCMADFLQGLLDECGPAPSAGLATGPEVPLAPSSPDFYYSRSAQVAPTQERLSIDRMMPMLARYFQPGDVIFGDAGGMINASQCQLPMGARLFGNGNWASIGSGFGGLVGASFAGDALGGQGRLLGLLGDGAFQMVAQDVSTLLKYDRDAALFIFNNAGYAAERAIHPGKQRSYNDIQNWNYHLLGQAFGAQGRQCRGFEVWTEQELASALNDLEVVKGVALVNVHLEPEDFACFNKEFSEKLRH